LRSASVFFTGQKHSLVVPTRRNPRCSELNTLTDIGSTCSRWLAC
jgi:hypothetical protein